MKWAIFTTEPTQGGAWVFCFVTDDKGKEFWTEGPGYVAIAVGEIAEAFHGKK